MIAVRDWEDPRVATPIIELLTTLPFTGQRTREVWREVFATAAALRDPRFDDVALELPPTWNVGDDMKRFLTNRLAEVTANAMVRAFDDAAYAALAAELRKPKPGTPATEAQLLAAIYANPDDDGPRLVYADWLQERDDPRGEFIALQLQPAPDRAAQKRMRELAKQHQKVWLGPLAPVLGGDLELRRGFVAKATVKFRNQRDAEQYASHPAWATLEDLAWSDHVVKTDQERWARFIDPAMANLRRAWRPHAATLLAAPVTWRIEELHVAVHDGLDRDLFHELVASPKLPALRTLGVRGVTEPDWLADVKRCPPVLIVDGWFDAFGAWIAAAKATRLEMLAIDWGWTRSHLTRDARGAFTKLAMVMQVRSGGPSKQVIRQAANEMRKHLPAKLLTELTAHLEIKGERVPAPELEAVGIQKLR
jgi:uncharacterized protein (TIGR02996 family)